MEDNEEGVCGGYSVIQASLSEEVIVTCDDTWEGLKETLARQRESLVPSPELGRNLC